MTPLGIYVHVPFCASKCPYCDFYSLRQGEDAWEAYTNCIIERIKSYQERALPVDTVYFGGGTPGLIGAGRIGRILDAVRESFRVQPGAEVTVETNPGVGDESLFPGLAAAGVTRISLGLQSANADELRQLGRIQNRIDADIVGIVRVPKIVELPQPRHRHGPPRRIIILRENPFHPREACSI